MWSLTLGGLASCWNQRRLQRSVYVHRTTSELVKVRPQKNKYPQEKNCIWKREKRRKGDKERQRVKGKKGREIRREKIYHTTKNQSKYFHTKLNYKLASAS